MKSHGGSRGDHRLGGFLLFVVAIALFLGLGSTCAFADVIIDNGEPGTTSAGTWSVSGGSQPYGADSLWARNGAKYTWQIDSQPAGIYEVLMWWSGWSSRAASIPVAISHFDGTATLTINQKQNAGMWNSLGTYYFDSGGSVTITAASGSTVSTCADAVWFRLVSANSRPAAFIDDISPNPAAPGETIDFSGRGVDNEGPVKAYLWESSIDGELSDEAFFSRSLSAGTHVISFLVQDSDDLWSEAATMELRVGAAATEVVIDNRDGQTSRTGTWQVSGGTDPYGPDSLWARNGATFTWIFNPSQPGTYDVSMWWSGWSSRATSVSVAIDHANGRKTLSINQSQNAGKWNSLGSYYFSSSGRVTITAASGSTVSTCADAVKFAPKGQ